MKTIIQLYNVCNYSSDGCVYKGRYYGGGQKWEDGCDYDCVCVDSNSGQYRCTEK